MANHQTISANFTEQDTLATVTARGATTNSSLGLAGSVTFGNMVTLGNFVHRPVLCC